MKLEKSKHDQVLEQVVLRLIQKYPMHLIETNLEYKAPSNRVLGEIDILRTSPEGMYYMYEIKTCEEKYNVARKQYLRFKKYAPDEIIKGIFVGPDTVRRLR